MSGQFLLCVIIALLLLANWVTLYNRSDQVYQFKDGEMTVVSPHSQISRSKTSGLQSSPSDDAGRVSAAQFGLLESYFNAAVGLCPSQRVKSAEPSIAPQHSLLLTSVSSNDFRTFIEKALPYNRAIKSILDVCVLACPLCG
jgi:hypothetical protein